MTGGTPVLGTRVSVCSMYVLDWCCERACDDVEIEGCHSGQVRRATIRKWPVITILGGDAF